MGNGHILEGADCSHTTRGGKWEQINEFPVIVGDIHADIQIYRGLRPAGEQKPGGHPGGGVRGLEGINTFFQPWNPSAWGSNFYKPFLLYSTVQLPGTRCGTRLELPDTGRLGTLQHLLSPCAGFLLQNGSCLSSELPSSITPGPP